MKKSKGLFTAVGCIVILGVACAGYSAMNSYNKARQAAKSGKRDMAVTVQTGKVEHARIDNIFTFNGDIQALQSVDLQPKISGRLLTLQLEDGTPVEEGVLVKKGQLIGTIDDRENKAQLANAKAAKLVAEATLSVAKSNVSNAEAGLLNAKASMEQKLADKKSAQASADSAKVALTDKQRELTRQQGLLAKQATTQQTFDLAETAFEQAEAECSRANAAVTAADAQIRAAEANQKQAEANLERYKANVLESEAGLQQAIANLEQAEVNYSETKLYAPLNGVISHKYVDPGSMVSATTKIVTILDMAEVKVLIAVPMNHLASVVPGQTKAQLRTASLPGKIIDCDIEKIYPAVNTITRTAQVELRIKNILDARKEYALKDGMYATVDVMIESKPNVLAVPTALPIRNLSRNLIYRVKGDKVEAVDVKLGVRFGDKVEVLSGLNEGDEIVIVGQHRLTDGCPIKKLEGNNLSFKKE